MGCTKISRSSNHVKRMVRIQVKDVARTSSSLSKTLFFKNTTSIFPLVLYHLSFLCFVLLQDSRQVMVVVLEERPFLHDVFVAALSSAVVMSLLRLWEETAKRGIFEQKLNRKLVHISIGLVLMVFWPMFSGGSWAPLLAAVTPGINILRMLILGLGIQRNDAVVKSMSRYGDYRELLKGPLYYACTLTLATAVFWRTSPIAIAATCNLCAGDGMYSLNIHGYVSLPGFADIVGRRFGSQKLPYNHNKSFAGSIAMASAGFVASIGFMHYFSLFGLVHESRGLILGFFFTSLASAAVESLPISTAVDDNLTVTLTSVLVGSLVL